jgi:nicotinamidase-related amidase
MPRIDPAPVNRQLSRGKAGGVMAGVVFWDVDTQHDFMHADGKLYVPDSEQIIPNLKRLTDYAHTKGIRIIASADDHVPGHRELSGTPDWKETFPEHCMRGTKGQAKIPETRLREPLVIEPGHEDPAALADRVRSHPGDILLHKHWFDVFTNENIETVLGILAPMSVVLYGVAQDVCDKYAIEGLLRHYSQLRLYAVSDAMKPIDRDMAQRLLDQWAQQGVRIVKTSEIVEGGLLDSLLAA